MLARLALVTAALVAAFPAGAGGVAAPPATVKVLECSREAHAATFHGRMVRIEATQRMSMRFTLEEKHGIAFEAIAAPGLGRWRSSKPGVGAFGYRQTVRGLQQGATYRMKVDYRWKDANGKVIERARRRSRACRQFEQLPNLTARLVGAEDTDVRGVLRYAVRVANNGIARATGVAVRLTVDGGVVDTVTVRAAQARRAPGCSCSEAPSATSPSARPPIPTG